jgi:hypothetical protein
MADNSDGWIKHEPGPCPIPDAKRWEWEYISISSAPIAVKYPVAHPAKYEKYWLDGSITHYRLHTSAQDKDAVIAELRAALISTKAAIDAQPLTAVADTLWMPANVFKGGTVHDFIDHILAKTGGA